MALWRTEFFEKKANVLFKTLAKQQRNFQRDSKESSIFGSHFSIRITLQAANAGVEMREFSVSLMQSLHCKLSAAFVFFRKFSMELEVFHTN